MCSEHVDGEQIYQLQSNCNESTLKNKLFSSIHSNAHIYTLYNSWEG